MLIEIEVSADFEQRMDNQWMVEREINSDRWNWRWADERPTHMHVNNGVDDACKECGKDLRNEIHTRTNTQ